MEVETAAVVEAEARQEEVVVEMEVVWAGAEVEVERVGG